MASQPETDRKALAKAPVTTGKALQAFVPTTLDEAWRLAGALAASGMTPKTYGGDQNKCMVGIIAGAEVGLTPFAALQSIAVINGTPSLWGDGMLALVEASGLLEDFEEFDDGQKATCRAVRKGRATPIIRTFDMDQAKKAGLTGKQGPWTQYPDRMRQMRARSKALRDGFSDVLKGLKSAEEARDFAPIDGGTLTNGRGRIDVAQLADHTDDDTIDQVTGEVLDGKPTDQTGELTTLASAMSEIDAAELIADVNARVSALEPLLSDDDASALREHAMDRIAAMKAAA